MSPFNDIGNIPFDLNVLASLFPKNKYTEEKARKLEEAGTIIRLKQGLYVASPEETGKALNHNLIANHIYGPSYVSLETALRYYGLIPEHVYLTLSLTTKHSRSFKTPAGYYDFRKCEKEYFPIGVRTETEDGVSYLIATPEKALCDLINYSKGVNLRYLKDVEAYLEEDIRFYMDALPSFDISILEACAQYSRRAQSINTLIKYIQRRTSAPSARLNRHF